MMKTVGGKVVGTAVAVAVLAGSVALVYAVEVPLTFVLGVGAGIACLLWLRLLRDDVVELRGKVDALTRGAKTLERRTEEQYRALAELRRVTDASGLSAHQRADEIDRRIASLAREFESTVDRLAGNEEIITGLKAFLRLLRADHGSGVV